MKVQAALLQIVCFLLPQMALAEQPIFFATDRNRVGDNFGPNRRYRTECKHELYFGTAEAASHGKSVVDIFKGQDAQQEFLAKVQDAVSKSPRKDLIVFVHGCNNSFNAACLKAEQLSRSTGDPVLLYTWPSTGKLSNYDVDCANVEWSKEHFSQLLAKLQTIRKATDCRITLILHSLAARIYDWSAGACASGNSADHIVLVCPDLDSEVFQHDLEKYRGDANKIYLLVSRKDRVLALSQMFSGGYYRLGEGVGNFLGALHLPGGTPKQDAAEVTATTGSTSQSKSIQTVDYTVLDHGFWGHKLPYSLIANMLNTGKPGPGLKLEPAKLGELNRWTRFIRWSYDFKPPDAGCIGNCDRVVKAD